MEKNGYDSFYKEENGDYFHYDISSKKYKKIKLGTDRISFSQFVQKNRMIKKDWSASMVDLGDGVLGVQFHSILKSDMNPLDGSIVSVLESAVDWVDRNNYKGIIISGDG